MTKIPRKIHELKTAIKALSPNANLLEIKVTKDVRRRIEFELKETFKYESMSPNGLRGMHIYGVKITEEGEA